MRRIKIEELGGEDGGDVTAHGTVSADSTVAAVSSSAVSNCVASHSNSGPLRPSGAEGEEEDREEKGRHSHEADGDDIVVPPVALELN